MKELWKQIIGYEGRYEISSSGRVKSLAKYCNYKISKREVPLILKPCKDGRGYYNFTVVNNGKKKVLLVHVEMAKCFLPNPNGYKIVRHLNDIKADNRLKNLKWGTHSDNNNDSVKNGKLFRGGKSSKLKRLEVLKILSSKKSNTELGKKYGVTESTISKIKVGRSWNNVTKLPLKK
jgi:hypothetical protein